MADNASNDQDNNASNQIPVNPPFPVAIPGYIYPYQLPQIEDIEEPFDPITSFAINESGIFGPLDAERLKDFLRQKLHRKNRPAGTVLREYTTEKFRFKNQLSCLHQRIYQIKLCEEEKTDHLKQRIKELINALEKKKEMPRFIDHELYLTNAASKAIRKVGNEGPRTEAELLHLINTGRYDMQISDGERMRQISQLQKVLVVMDDNHEVEKLHRDFACKRISKAIKDIMRELVMEDRD